jgi:hypothetical protein
LFPLLRPLFPVLVGYHRNFILHVHNEFRLDLQIGC